MPVFFTRSDTWSQSNTELDFALPREGNPSFRLPVHLRERPQALDELSVLRWGGCSCLMAAVGYLPFLYNLPCRKTEWGDETGSAISRHCLNTAYLNTSHLVFVHSMSLMTGPIQRLVHLITVCTPSMAVISSAG